jgi:hypothetical protein
MKTLNLIAAIGITSAILAHEAMAAKPGRPEALTRGIGMAQTQPARAVSDIRETLRTGRPEALTRGVGGGDAIPSANIANNLTPEQKAGKPEYHTRGIYCPHRGKRG